MKSITQLILMAALLFSPLAFSQETEQDAWGERVSGGYFSIGGGIEYREDLYRDRGFRLRVALNGAYYFENGLFVEFPGRPSKFNPDFAVGYNLLNYENWEFDIIGSFSHGSLEYQNEEMKFDKMATIYAGRRGTGSVLGVDVQFIAAPFNYHPDYDGGMYGSLWLSKSVFWKNTQFYGSVGAQYRNAELLDFYYGTSDVSADTSLPEYHAGAGVNVTYQVGFSYPFSEDIVVDGYVRHTQIADTILDSPYSQSVMLGDGYRAPSRSVVGIIINYVF